MKKKEGSRNQEIMKPKRPRDHIIPENEGVHDTKLVSETKRIRDTISGRETIT